ncbi:protein of unknown function [Shewanella benthica]|uniref:Uncharacterized protein n=1 Tax=Shewanella benthica TaxID=43661 RepID=A0A330M1H8_9GAMM|nr:protein of unknown function [Shewanella benthica]
MFLLGLWRYLLALKKYRKQLPLLKLNRNQLSKWSLLESMLHH